MPLTKERIPKPKKIASVPMVIKPEKPKKKKKGRPRKEKPTEEKKKAGRPQAEVSRVSFEKLCSLQCTIEEIAAVLLVSKDTIYRWCQKEYNMPFADVYEKKRHFGLASLRRTQFKLSENSAPMAIWLGKQLLGQKDHIVTENTFVNSPQVVVADDSKSTGQ